MTDYKETLRRLALNDEGFMESELGVGVGPRERSHLDPKTHALVRLGASLAIDAAPSSYQAAVEPALAGRHHRRDRRDPDRGGPHRRSGTRRLGCS